MRRALLLATVATALFASLALLTVTATAQTFDNKSVSGVIIPVSEPRLLVFGIEGRTCSVSRFVLTSEWLNASYSCPTNTSIAFPVLEMKVTVSNIPSNGSRSPRSGNLGPFRVF